ncbi:MAG: 3-oxoacyl-ACP reductase FabG [Candidatus Binatia bacterium]|nr:3-oxoacyl-ACP reductase FabG [Candidatus Binatia bacterium]
MGAATRTAVVTGGASGIGRAISLRLARDGANVAIFDLDRTGAEAVAAEITTLGRKGEVYQVDVANRTQVEAAVQRVRRELGPIHILVNDAGIGEFVPLAQMSEAQWDRMIAIHLKGTFNCTKAVIQDMVDAKWGRIVNISSVAGLGGGAGLVHYSAAKAGIIGFTKALAQEVGPMGITVNAIAPGLIDTPILRKSDLPEEQVQQFIETIVGRTPVRRVGIPDDIAAACAYLVSEEASFFTGQVISPNGGMYT